MGAPRVEQFGGRDGGFTIVEVLVALVLASVLMMAVGGLFAFSGQLRDQTKLVGAVEQSILDTRALAQVLDVWSTASIEVSTSDVEARRFSLEKTSGAGVKTELTMAIVGDAEKPRSLILNAAAPAQTSSVDLSSFDDAEIEYLALGDQTATWVAFDALASVAPMAVRIDLRRADRHWFVLLWQRNR